MLVLSRKTGQSVHLGIGPRGEDILIKVIDLGGGRVRLGIEAPASVTIVRGELGPLEPRRLPASAPSTRIARPIAHVA